MVRKALITILLSLLTAAASTAAGDKKGDCPTVTYGAEWSYVASFCTSLHQNFFSADGARVDVNGIYPGFKSNGEMYLHVGANLGTRWNLSVYAGYTSIVNLDSAVPVSLRLTGFFGPDPLTDRWLAFVDLGSGIALTEKTSPILGAKIGGGYRLSLSRAVKLDIVASYRLTYTNPDVIHYGQMIPPELVNRNNAFISAITIGLNITL